MHFTELGERAVTSLLKKDQTVYMSDEKNRFSFILNYC